MVERKTRAFPARSVENERRLGKLRKTPFPNTISQRLFQAFLACCRRSLLREGGWLVVYTDREPARPPRRNHALRIVVVLRPHHGPRIAGVFQKRKPGMPHYGTEPGEAELAEPWGAQSPVALSLGN